jgi:hypothetical protein
LEIHILRVFLFFFFLFKFSLTQAIILEADNFSKAKEILESATQEDLILFDVDEVLLRFQNPLYPQHYSKYKAFIVDKSRQFEQKEAAHIKALTMTPYKMSLVDPSWPGLIHDLQEKGIQTIALTKASSGKLGHFRSLSELRRHTLRRHNIHFHRSFSDLSRKTFGDVSFYDSDDLPLYEDGIIYTCCFQKSIFLNQFLEHAKLKPKKIFFIDDLDDNLKDVQDYCEKNQIEFLGIHFTQIEKEEEPIFDMELAENEYQKLHQDHFRFSKKTLPVFPKNIPKLHEFMLSAFGHHLDEVPYCDHLPWVQKILTYLQNLPIGEEEAAEILSCFDQQDARLLLRPLLGHFKFDLTEELVQEHFKSKIQFIKDGHKKTSPEAFYHENTCEILFLAAQKAYETIKGNILFVLGQTPAYLGVMIEEIARLNKDHETQIIHIPFSGRPDYFKKLNGQAVIDSSYLNLITREKENIFRYILFDHDFSPNIVEERKIFVVDNSSGPSIDSFLALVKRWFDDEEKIYPETHILHMAKKEELGRMIGSKWQQMENLNLQICPDIASLIFLEMDDEILKNFDKIYDNLRIVPSFNGLFWRDGYKEFLKQYPSRDAIPLIEHYKNYVRQKLN